MEETCPQDDTTQPLEEEKEEGEGDTTYREDNTLILGVTATIAHEWYIGLLTEQEAVRLMHGLQLVPGSEFVL